MALELERAEPATVAPDRFDDLFERLYPPLFHLAWRVTGDAGHAEEAVQDAFLRLAAAPLLARPDDEVAAWLRRVCLHLSLNRLRDERRATLRLERVGRRDPETAAGIDHDADPAIAADRAADRAAVRATLAHLPERQRDALLLRHAGHSYAEIAATLGVAVGSVGVLLARAERAFRHHYGEHCHDDVS